jgi:DnaK suppressor protein
VSQPDLAAAIDAARTLVESLSEELAGIFDAQAADPPDDEHDVEGSSIGFERARVTALLASAQESLAALLDAQRRVVAGTYGSCAFCGGIVDPERLAAVPTTDRCVSCARSAPAATLLGLRRRLDPRLR